MRITDKYVFFYKDWLSNYQRTKIKYKFLGREYEFSSTEQAFMFVKAMTFGDRYIANKILETDNPNEARKLGRQVRNYDDKTWDKVRWLVFYNLNILKYTQDEKLKKMLLDPKFDGKTFVEASPIDKIWGVGLDENNPLIEDEKNWRGTNYLGDIITKVRNKLKETYVGENL